MASRQQEAAAATAQPANAPTQPPPAEQAPADASAATAPDTTAPAENKAPENDTNAKPDSTKAASSNATASSAETSSAETKTVVTKRPSRSISAPPAAPRKIVVRRGRCERARDTDRPRHDSRRSRPRAPERGAVAAIHRRSATAVGGTLPMPHSKRPSDRFATTWMAPVRALQEGDVRRASTLAEKAHLLAEDLLRQ